MWQQFTRGTALNSASGRVVSVIRVRKSFTSQGHIQCWPFFYASNHVYSKFSLDLWRPSGWLRLRSRMALVSTRPNQGPETFTADTPGPALAQRQKFLHSLQSSSSSLLAITPLGVHGSWYHSSLGGFVGGDHVGQSDDVNRSTLAEREEKVVALMEDYKKRLNDKLEQSFLHDTEGIIKAAFSPYWIQESTSRHWTEWNRESLLWHLADRLYWFFSHTNSTSSPSLAQCGDTHPPPTSLSDDDDGVPDYVRDVQQSWIKPIKAFMKKNKQLYSSQDPPVAVVNPLESLMAQYNIKKGARVDGRVEKCFLHAAICLRAILFVRDDNYSIALTLT